MRKQCIASDRDIDAIIAGEYKETDEEDGDDIATDEEIDAIIAGTFNERE